MIVLPYIMINLMSYSSLLSMLESIHKQKSGKAIGRDNVAIEAIYSVSQKNYPLRLLSIFAKRLRIFN